MDFLAGNPQRALIVGNDAGEDLHQCAFARAVLPDNRMEFTGADVEGHIIESGDARKPLGDVFRPR